MTDVAVSLSTLTELAASRKMVLADLPIVPRVQGTNAHFESVDDLKRLARTMDLRLSSFFESSETDLDDGVRIGRAKAAFVKKVQRDGKDYYTYHHLATTRTEPNLMALRVDLHGSPDHVVLNPGHACKELVYVTRGRVRFDWQDNDEAARSTTLQAGDSVYVSPGVPHSFVSDDGEPAEIIAVNY